MTLDKRLIGKFLLQKCLYLGKKNYLIHADGEREEVDKNYRERVHLVILGKACYFETLKTFSFSHTKDIRAAVEIDMSRYSPLKGGKFFIRKITDKGEGATVNLWFIDERTTERLSTLSPLFVIPESALVSFADRGTDHLYHIHLGEQEDLCVFVNRDGGVQSMSTRGHDGDFQRFTRSIGAAAHHCEVTVIPGDKDFFALFPTTLRALSVKNIWPFLAWTPRSFDIDKKHARLGIATVTALFLLYLGIAGGWTALIYSRLQQKDAMLSQNLAGLLEKRERVDVCNEKQKELDLKINCCTPRLPLINLLNKILPAGSVIRQITIAGNVVEMRGSVPQASTLLSILSQGQGVKNARFLSPLQEDKKTGGELFHITFFYGRKTNQ